LLQEVEVEPLASELAVGDALDPGRLELWNHLGDGGVLDCTQLYVVDLPSRATRPRGMDCRGPQEAPDVIRSEWWCDLRHGSSSRGLGFRCRACCGGCRAV
jgi:hypothetical protein